MRLQFVAFGAMAAAPLLLAASIAGAQNPDDPKDLLLRARQNALDTLKRLPRYVCTQTVDRFRYEPFNADYELGTQGRSPGRTAAR